MKHELGSEVKDKITGFVGIVVARTAWINGCTRYGVQSRELKDGKPIDAEWFDEQSLVVFSEGVGDDKVERGGPRSDPSRSRSGES